MDSSGHRRKQKRTATAWHLEATQHQKILQSCYRVHELLCCQIFQYTSEVIVHENIPNQPGDVLGLLLRSACAAKYIPYLRNDSLTPGATPPLSYYLWRQGSSLADIYSVKQGNGDNHIPLATFEICKYTYTSLTYSIATKGLVLTLRCFR